MGSDLAAMTFLGPIGMAVVWREKKKKLGICPRVHLAWPVAFRKRAGKAKRAVTQTPRNAFLVHSRNPQQFVAQGFISWK